MSNIVLRLLAFLGPRMSPASVEFRKGLNVVCGASETGKSFIVESVDFMLGASRPLRDIPERTGYDRVRLSIGPDDSNPITLERSVEGGDYKAFEGLLEYSDPQAEPSVLRERHSGARGDTLSHVLVSRVGLSGKRLRKNKSGETRTLSFRDLVRLCLVNEDRIQTPDSPILSGQYTQATPEYAAFKLLLTGVDDSSLVFGKETADRGEVERGKVELLDEMIRELQEDLAEQGIEQTEVRDQIARLEASIRQQSESLRAVQTKLDDTLARRRSLGDEVRLRRGRLEEIQELTIRFDLLARHYGTDLSRLAAIRESGSIFVHLEAEQCPLCGALPEAQHDEEDCDGNVEQVVAAADAEIAKVGRLRDELRETMNSLDEERAQINGELADLDVRYRRVEQEVAEIAAPAVETERSSYEPLVLERSEARRKLDRIEQLQRLIDQRGGLIGSQAEGGTGGGGKTEIASSVLDAFSRSVERILSEWHYPEAERVFFDDSKKDFQIAGKERGSSGKGLRAITHAAVAVALLEFCQDNNLPHPGFVILDSPLLAYWKPEGEEDDLSGTDLKDRFYEYLARRHSTSQIIVIENEHPPEDIEGANVVVFTKNPYHGRYGFFPVVDQAGAHR